MLKKKFICTALFLSILFSLGAQNIPGGYYNTIDQKSERELKTALHKILKEHVTLRYSDLWIYFRTSDARADGRTVWDMYSNETRYFGEGNSSSTSGMHKEHSLPKSWWGSSPDNEKVAAYTDLNHLYPGDGSANTAKSNYMLGIVSSPTFNNGVSKVGKNTYSYTGSPSANSFEPADQYKGDFARTYLYMITCYEDYSTQWRSDALNMFNMETYPVLRDWARDMLLKWHRNDPVSEKELLRNEEVYKYQSNRNPYIDFPQLVEYIWGDSTAYTFTLPEIHKTEDPTLITPPINSELYYDYVEKNTSVEQSLIVKGVSLTGNLSARLYGGDKDCFRVSASSISSVLVNSSSGYQLTVTFNPTEYGEYSTSLIISDGGMRGSVSVALTGICTDAEPPSSMPVYATELDLYAVGNEIHFRSYQTGGLVQLYTIAGQLIYSGNNSAEWESVSVPHSGIYLIRINNKTKKIVISQ